MGRILFLFLILGAAALAAAALLRPVSEERHDLGHAGVVRLEESARLVGRAPPPIPSPGHDLASSLEVARSASDASRLRHWAVHADDARVRRASAVRLVELLGVRARPFLLTRITDETESLKVRAACAELLGRCGPEALLDLEAILDGGLPRRVRAGAAAGLVAVGESEPRAAARLDGILHGPSGDLPDAVAAALGASTSHWARGLAMHFVGDGLLAPRHRASLARWLGAQKVQTARTTLQEVVGDAHAAPEVREAAAEALGLLGNPEASATLVEIGEDASPALLRAAAVARQRLARRAAEQR